MARNCASYAITILLIIGVVICSAITNLHDTISKQRWTRSYYIAFELDICIARCRRQFPHESISKAFCIAQCYEQYRRLPP
ncbi:uncharacterized protein DS421_3g92560 [Arachis hypogaea]|nr:uncharacterized protein DS421_3g92560 [Arachis hypogaea]